MNAMSPRHGVTHTIPEGGYQPFILSVMHYQEKHVQAARELQETITRETQMMKAAHDKLALHETPAADREQLREMHREWDKHENEKLNAEHVLNIENNRIKAAQTLLSIHHRHGEQAVHECIAAYDAHRKAAANAGFNKVPPPKIKWPAHTQAVVAEMYPAVAQRKKNLTRRGFGVALGATVAAIAADRYSLETSHTLAPALAAGGGTAVALFSSAHEIAHRGPEIRNAQDELDDFFINISEIFSNSERERRGDSFKSL